MLGASFKLDEYFNNYYCDAAGNRNCSESVAILQTLIDRNLVGDFVVIHLGTNWGLSQQNLDDMNAVLNGQKIFWLTLTNSWGKNDNPMLIEYCENHENNYCIDWNAYSKGRDELFIGDGIHLSDEGQGVYDKYIFDYLADVIKQELNIKKENLLNSYNNQYNNNISFYGNDILLNIYNNLNQNYKFFPNSDYDFTSLYKQLSNDKDNLNLSKTIYIVLDKTVLLSKQELIQIQELLSNNELHILAYDIENTDLNVNLTNILNRECELEDGIHLNEKGNSILLEKINSIIN